MMLRLLKDPLGHFLILGLGLFLIYGALNPQANTADNRKRIIVDKDALLTFIQYRTRTFKKDLADARLNAMSAEQLKRLIDDYVREEALHREATALGLGNEDYIIKRRMIQKVEFITQGFAEAIVKVSERELQDYHAANKERYREPGSITFTHVFFDVERRSRDKAWALAVAKLSELNAGTVKFSDAPRHGERFPYGVNYVERTEDHVASQFGLEMAKQLFSVKPSDTIWRGPFESEYGTHLVMVVRRLETRDPPLKEVIGRVEAELVRDRRREQADKAIQSIVDDYEVELDLDGKAGKTLAQLNKTN